MNLRLFTQLAFYSMLTQPLCHSLCDTGNIPLISLLPPVFLTVTSRKIQGDKSTFAPNLQAILAISTGGFA